ncbi:ABC-type nitrate/sulfonate/bicarbonate transport system permease component [Rhizobium sp. BK313]|uniref:ABC transporter permease n=1 Tax=Rhizobium sp. BK313 TaxID=2587081 RepID=UPI00105F6DD7|nr:ABC transporter permease [Rhizobium sp. BK313]MBB3456660.1 ABC-type nitrate/sulfonate/bicarbonate transport system permease component [Rhizobium sp. BK313]
MSRRPSAFAPSALPTAIIGALPAIAAAVGFLALWELYADFSGIRPSILPAPSRVLAQGWINRQALIDNTWPTLSTTLAGFGCSLAVAFVFSVLMDFARPVRRALFPLFVISQTLPLVAIAPLVVLWFGFGLVPKILLVALVTFFPMLVALLQGYEATDKDIHELLISMKASRWRIFFLARLPSAQPYFFAGLRIAITYAVVGAIFAEYAGAAKGLGIYILNAKNNFRPDLVLAAVFVSAGLTLVLFAITVLLGHLAMPWRHTERPTSP